VLKGSIQSFNIGQNVKKKETPSFVPFFLVNLKDATEYKFHSLIISAFVIGQ